MELKKIKDLEENRWIKHTGKWDSKREELLNDLNS